MRKIFTRLIAILCVLSMAFVNPFDYQQAYAAALDSIAYAATQDELCYINNGISTISYTESGQGTILTYGKKQYLIYTNGKIEKEQDD